MRISLVLVIIMWTLKVGGQDIQFSQYYAAPLFLNPALTGATDCYRAGFNARSQWTGLPGGAFNTVSAFVDLNYPDVRSGFGLMALYDVVGTPNMSSSEFSGFYSFLASFSDQFNLRMGLQGTYVSRSLNYDRLYFEDQFTGISVTNSNTKDPLKNHDRNNYADISAGLFLYGEDSYWLGFAAHHLTMPDQGFYLNSRLPVKFSLHGGWKFIIKNRRREEISVYPTFMYKSQNKFDQVDFGFYVIRAPLMLGLWYRGIPVKDDYKIFNRDAIDVQLGLQFGDLSIGYSYDFTISALNIVNTHGSHEISLIYLFCLDWPKRRKPPRHVRKIPCPDFKRSMKYKKNFLGF